MFLNRLSQVEIAGSDQSDHEAPATSATATSAIGRRFRGARALAPAQSRMRMSQDWGQVYSVYFLCWYKSTNTDAEVSAGGVLRK